MCANFRAVGLVRACGRVLRWPEVPRHSGFAPATALGIFAQVSRSLGAAHLGLAVACLFALC